MAKDVESFTKSCLHCLSTNSDEVIPRPLGLTGHATKPNKLIHFDFRYINKGIDNYEYVLIIKDDFSGYTSFVPAQFADAETTARALMSWFSTYGTVHSWVFDRGTHFKNELVKQLKNTTHSLHHFTLAYTPCTNGSVEVVFRELL